MAENGSVIIKIKGDDKDFSGKLKNLGGVATTAMKAVTAGATMAGAAVAALGKSAIDAYADYEQLVGGVETLFKDSADIVKQYADNAYKTAGISANTYMETVTSFSASLLQSLGGDTKAAADMSDMALRDMSDNANKMGSDMETIIQTYQSLSRGNYAMLDNLKLGFGGTKAEMERLIATAAELDSSVQANDMSFGNMVKAIHAVQTEMGITGTTAKEATETISGSVAATKAAWQNMLVGIADENADFEVLLSNLLESIGTAAENILPRIKVVLEGIGNLVVELAPTMVDTAVELLTQFGQYLSDNAPAMLQRVPEIITRLATTIADNAPKLVAVAGQLIVAMASGLIATIPKLVASAPTIVVSLARGIIGAGGEMVKAASSISGMFAEKIKELPQKMLQIGRDIVQGVINGIKNKTGAVAQAARDMASSVLSSMKNRLGIRSPSKKAEDEVGSMVGEGSAVGLLKSGRKVAQASDKLAKEISDSFSDGLGSRMTNAYGKMRNAMYSGMRKLTGDIAVQAKGNTSYTTNTTHTKEGDFVVHIDKVVNDGKGTVADVLQEAEFIRRQKELAKGGV